MKLMNQNNWSIIHASNSSMIINFFSSRSSWHVYLMTSPTDSSSVSTGSSASASEDLLGVKFSYFEQFIAENGGRETFTGKTTSEINATVLAPICDRNGMSVCQQLLQQKSSFVGKPAWFISHAWSYQFLDVIEAVGLTLRRRDGEDKYRDVVIWFDQFTMLHPAPPMLPYDILHDTFMNSTRAIGRMILVFDKWDNPLHLTRAWCVFEVYACLATSSVLEVALTESESNRFSEMIRKDHSTFYKMLTQIDSRNSAARYEDEQNKIHQAIRENIVGGFTSLDRSIFAELEKWMTQLLCRHVAVAESDMEKAQWMAALGGVYTVSGKHNQAEPMYLDALMILRRVLGDDDSSTLVTINNLANSYMAQGKYDQAEPLFLEALNTSRRILGEEDSDTLTSINNLAGLYRSQGKFDRAEPLYVQCLAIRRRVLGNEHPYTLAVINNLGGLYKIERKYELSEPLLLEALSISRRVLGETHPDTLICTNNLAGLYRSQGNLSQAESLYFSTIENMRRVLGNEHPDTLSGINNLADCYMAHGKLEQAEPLF